jgi:hypothetical protein
MDFFMKLLVVVLCSVGFCIPALAHYVRYKRQYIPYVCCPYCRADFCLTGVDWHNGGRRTDIYTCGTRVTGGFRKITVTKGFRCPQKRRDSDTEAML